VLDLLVQVLPKVVEAASLPISGIDRMTVISTDGASSLTKSVASNVAQGLQLGTDLTGVDLAGLLGRLGSAAKAPTDVTPAVPAANPSPGPRGKTVSNGGPVDGRPVETASE
jgi:flotillin